LTADILINPEKWEEVNAPERTPEAAAIVQEFLSEYPPAERELWAQKARKKKFTARRLKEYRLDPIEARSGALIAYNAIASESGSISEGGGSSSFQFRHEGRQYYVEDLYCSNPHCRCNEVHLDFFEYKATGDGEDLLEQCFLAKMPLKGGAVSIERSPHWPREEARKVAAAWQEKFADAMPTLVWRDSRIKEIARRSIRESKRPARRTLATSGNLRLDLPFSARPGRNDVCPCGSGKKFKKCCGR
jgi:hypothetical protein